MKIQRRIFLKGFSISSVLVGCPTLNWGSELSLDEQVLFGIIRPADIRGEGFKLRSKAADAFEEMCRHALKDGIKIYSFSSYRGFQHQSQIWNRKYTDFSKRIKQPEQVVREIIKYSTIPGTSRHHWGTDLDMIDNNPKRPADVLEQKNFEAGGVYHKLYEWLLKHGNSFGFYESYTNAPNRTGFEYEPWHWSFAELSVPMLEQYMSLPLHEKLPLQDLEGHTLLDEAFLNQYKTSWVLGVDNRLLPESIEKTDSKRINSAE